MPYIGRPRDAEKRLPIELAVYDMLDSLGINYCGIDHDAAFTMEACREIDAALQVSVMCKNLFLCNGGKTQFYLLLMTGDKLFSTKDFSGLIGCSRLSFAPAEYMERYLGVTPGSVTVLGLMNDKDCRVKLYIDKDVLADKYIGCHPCINTSSLKIETADITDRFLPFIKHTYEAVDLSSFKRIERDDA